MIRLLDLAKINSAYQQELERTLGKHIQSSDYISGNSVNIFENEFASYTSAKRCIGCANGTDAIEIVLQALNLDPEDEVIVPAMTWISTAEAVCRQGLKPVFCDVDSSLLLDPQKLECLLTKRTRAVILVHLYGNPSNSERVQRFCRENDLFLIEDCAQAHGAKYENKHVGNFGIAGTFSFFPGKNLGALGDAGCIISNSSEIAELCLRIRNHGQIKKHDHSPTIVGRNSRLDSIQASFLSVKLKRLDNDNERRRCIASSYRSVIPADCCLPETTQHHVFHQFVLRVPSRDKFIEYMANLGIETGIHYPNGLPFMEVFSSYTGPNPDFPNVKKLQKEIVTIPVGPHLNDEEIAYIQNSLSTYFRGR